MKIAVLGTGTMGAPMARNLAKAGHEVAAWNRTAERAAPLADDGIRVAATPGEAAEGAEALVTMLTDADATLEAAPEALRALGDDALWWQVGTVGVDGARRLGELADEHGVAYVDGPVSGTKKPAEDGQLLILASGTDGAIDRLQPLFDATGKATKRCGAAPNGSKLKLVLNAWLGGLVGVLAESVALAQAEGLDSQDFLDAIAAARSTRPTPSSRAGRWPRGVPVLLRAGQRAEGPALRHRRRGALGPRARRARRDARALHEGLRRRPRRRGPRRGGQGRRAGRLGLRGAQHEVVEEPRGQAAARAGGGPPAGRRGSRGRRTGARPSGCPRPRPRTPARGWSTRTSWPAAPRRAR